MKVLIIGGAGMLGHKLLENLSGTFEVAATIKNEIGFYDAVKVFEKKKIFDNVDVLDEAKLRNVISSFKPDVAINCVGIIKQLPKSKNVEHTLLVNSIFPHRLASVLRQFGARLITFGTDCVFSGERGLYKEEDAPDALDLYGRSKHFGEVSEGDCLTLRTSIIGRELFTKHSLAEWFLQNRSPQVKGYKRAVFSGFPTAVMAEIVSDVIARHKNLRGLYHLSAEPINKYDLLCLLKEEYKVGAEIEADENFIIDRSLDSSRFREAAGFRPKSWREMIAQMASDDALYEK